MQRYDYTHVDTRNQQATPVTKADLSKAIAQGLLPYRRDGDQYIVHQEYVRKLQTHRHHRPDSAPKPDTLKMGRTA